MIAYAELVKTAWRTWATPKADGNRPGVLWPGFPLGTRFAFRRDDLGRLRACFIEYDEAGFVDMKASYLVDEERF